MAKMNRSGLRKHAFHFEHDDEDGNTHEVRGFVKELDDQTVMLLDKWIGEDVRYTDRYDPAIARVSVVREGTDGPLKIDNKSYALGKPNVRIPRYHDPELDKTVIEHVLGYVILHNPFLVEEDRYRDTFENYALDDEDPPESNPTELPVKREQTG